jgi:hypothetical protein
MQKHANGMDLYALCMDVRAFQCLTQLALPGLHPIELSDFEAGDTDLRNAKSNRSLIEYYFTCTPSLPLHVLRNHPEIERILYIDADMYFFSSISSVLDEWGDGAVYIVDHRFPEKTRPYFEQFGKYNVGILGFCNDKEGLQCLKRWRQQCNDWCYDKLENGKFADQKYLESWPSVFPNVVVSRHNGVNVAPWNKQRYHLHIKNRIPHVDDQPIVCYHYHGLRLLEFGLVHLQRHNYGARLGSDWIRWVYAPYLQELAKAEKIAGGIQRHELRSRAKLSFVDLANSLEPVQIAIPTGHGWVELSPQIVSGLFRLARLFPSRQERKRA